tara:strand:+ start:492 stop:716 length:225 start_codon:yes stop_codon:yes gene_type:complete
MITKNQKIIQTYASKKSLMNEGQKQSLKVKSASEVDFSYLTDAGKPTPITKGQRFIVDYVSDDDSDTEIDNVYG